VVVTNAAMGTKVSATTGADGFYQRYFCSGIYKMEATAKGLRSWSAQP